MFLHHRFATEVIFKDVGIISCLLADQYIVMLSGEKEEDVFMKFTLVMLSSGNSLTNISIPHILYTVHTHTHLIEIIS